MNRRGPLAGIRVLDLGQYIAGPAVAMMLADHGADVVRIDPPGGRSWKSPAAAVLDRGKSSLVMDLRKRDDVERVRQLVSEADVFIENARPGVMAGLGLGAEELTALNPRLVYLSLPGFASGDEGAGDVRAWEGVVAAAGGIYSDMSVHRRLYGKVPSYTALPMASSDAVALGALGVLTALVRRRRTGRGDIVEVPLLAALQECTPFNTMRIHGMPGRYLSDAEHELDRRRASGEPLDMTFEQVDELRDPFYARYRCSDGRPFFVCCVGHRGHIQRLLKGLGLWDQLVAEGLPRADPFTSSRDWGPEAEGNTVYAYPLKGRWARRIRDLLRERFATRSSTEWERFFSERRLPGVADRSTEEWLACEHALAAGLVVSVDDPIRGPMLQPGPYCWIDRYRDVYRDLRPARGLDADRERFLGDGADAWPERPALPLAASPHDLEERAAEDDRLPLDGLRILDASNVIAGPTAAGVLTRFGAECIKLDRPYPELDPGLSVMYSLHCSRGKRSMMLDAKSEDGREILRELLRAVDVVVYNGFERQLRDLGLDLDSLKAANPDVILCRISAYGGPFPGPRSDEPGYDECAQSLTGLSVRNGGSLQRAEETASVGCLDNLCGFLGSCAILLGLLEQTHERGALQVETSLTATSQLLQIPFLYEYDGRPPFDEPAGPNTLGAHALYRLYPTSDGWLFFAATRKQFQKLCGLDEFSGLGTSLPAEEGDGPCARLDPAASAQDQALARDLEERFRRRTTGHWVEELTAFGCGVAAVRSYDDMVDERLAEEDAPLRELPAPVFVRHDSHPSGYVIDQVAQSAIAMDRGGVVEPGSPPRFGTHTREILAELGLSPEDIDGLIRSGVAREGWCEQYLPD